MSGNPSPGWYPDPQNPDLVRWWDGANWSDVTHLSPARGGYPAQQQEPQYQEPQYPEYPESPAFSGYQEGRGYAGNEDGYGYQDERGGYQDERGYLGNQEYLGGPRYGRGRRGSSRGLLIGGIATAAVLLAAGVAFASSGGGAPTASTQSSTMRSAATQSASSTPAPAGTARGATSSSMAGGSAVCQKIPGELTRSYQGIRQDLTNASSPQAAVTDLRTEASGWRQTARTAAAYPQLSQATTTLANTLDTLAQTISSGGVIAIGSTGMALESEWGTILKAQKQDC